MTSPRTPQERKRDTLERLARDVNAWVATADPASGAPWLVPLSFLWDGETLLVATLASSPTGRNLIATGMARIGIGSTSDVILIDGVATAVDAGAIDDETAAAFALRAGFDPRRQASDYRSFRIIPRRIQAWRGPDELADRDLMRDGRWLVS